MRSKLFLLLVSLTCHASICAQTPSASSNGSAGAPNNRMLDRAARIEAVRSFASRATAFQDLQSKVMTLANLGDILWSQKGQEAYARHLLLGLYDQLLAESPGAAAASKTRDSVNSTTIERLKQTVIRSIAHHDLKLAHKLMSDEIPAGPEADARTNIRLLDTANDLVRDGDAPAATEMASRAFGGEFTRRMVETLLMFLHRLRAADEAAADALFTQVLERLARQATVSPDDLLVMGNYLFIDEQSVTPGNIHYSKSIVLFRTYSTATIIIDDRAFQPYWKQMSDAEKHELLWENPVAGSAPVG